MLASSSAGDFHADFHGVFTLMDHRGFGKITLDAIFDFCNAMPHPPPAESVTEIYRKFDEDASGDIDTQEFIGLCAALEDLLNLNAAQMITEFERAQYKRLFQLVDEDNGGTIDSNELKTVIEALAGMLSLKGSAADVAILMRDVNSNELEFEEFYTVMKKFCKGKPIQHVVKAFEEAQRRSHESKSFALKKFQNAAAETRQTVAVKKSLDRERVCIGCTKKELEIRELRSRLSELEAQLSQSFSQVDVASLINVESKLEQASKSVEVAVGIFKQFAPALQSAAHHAKSSRIRRIVESNLSTTQDQQSRRLSELADVAHRTQRQIGPAFDPVREAACAIVKLKLEAIEELKEKKSNNVASYMRECAEKCSAHRMQCAAMSENIGWVAEVTAEVRSTLSEAALAAACFTSAPGKLMIVVRNAEDATEEMWQLFSLLAFYSSENKSDVEELFDQGGAASGVNIGVLDDYAERARRELTLLSKIAFDGLNGRLKDTVYAFQSVAASMQSNSRKDRGVGTQPLEAILPVEPLRRLPPAKRHEDPGPVNQASSMSSRPARGRDIFAEPDRRAETVDALVSRYLASGVLVPSNFARVRLLDERMVHRHSFQFGTKTIELVIVDEYIAVIVGGGYMYFDEFCERFTEAEQLKLNRDIALKRGKSPMAVGASSSASPPASPGRKVIQRFATKPTQLGTSSSPLGLHGAASVGRGNSPDPGASGQATPKATTIGRTASMAGPPPSL